MAKTIIRGRFATAADVASVHEISDSRRVWLDREIGKATAEVAMFFTPPTTKLKTAAPSRSKRSAKTARLRAKRK